MREQFQRTEMLIGEEALNKLFKAHVAVFGIGGVGGYVVEALARAGIGALTLVDHDTVSESNLNRQIIATHDTIGKLKVEVAKERVLSINTDCKVTTYPFFVLPDKESKEPSLIYVDEQAENRDSGEQSTACDVSSDAADKQKIAVSFSGYDYIVDAIDTVTGKLGIIEKAKREGVPIISCMGTGNKMDPTAFQVADLYQTTVCPLAKVMRKELRKRGIESLKVVYSTEEPIKPVKQAEQDNAGTDKTDSKVRPKDVPGSNSFTPAAAGLVIASEVVKDLIA